MPGASDLITRARALPGLAALAELPGVHLVGGSVRDLLLGGTPKDLDLVTEGDPLAVAQRLGPVVAVHERFGTATVRDGERQWDVARARRERYPRPGALPEVEPAPLEEDLLRRDFTVNTFALELATGDLRAVPEAPGDLGARLLRVLHRASFADDPTRLLRLARYAGRLGFAPESGTAALAQAAVAEGALDTVSGARLGAELRLLLEERAALAAFAVLGRLGVDEGLAPGFGLRDELGARVLAALPPDGRREVALLAAASQDVADPAALLERLAFRRETIDAVRMALAVPDLTGCSPGEVAERLASVEQAALAAALGADEARNWLEETRHLRLSISGEDLRAAGAPEGPALGAALRGVLRARRDGTLPAGREAELAAALAILEG